MTSAYDIDFDDLEQQIRKTLENALKININQILPSVGELIVSDIQEKYDRLGQGGNVPLYDGTNLKFKDIADATKAQRKRGVKSGGKNEELPSWPPPRGYLLQRTGDLKSSIHYEVAGGAIGIGYGMDYGKYLYDPQNQWGWNFLFISQDALEDIVDVVELFISQKI